MANEFSLEEILSAKNPSAQPRPDFSFDQLIPKSVGRSTPNADEAPSRIGSLVRGYAKRGAELISDVGDIAYKSSLAPGARRGESFDSGAAVEGDVGDVMSGLGALPATDATGKAIERAGDWMFDASITAPLVMSAAPALGLNPVVAALGEMGAAGGGGFTESLLADEGQEGAGLIAGTAMAMAGAPLSVGARKGAEGARRVANRISQMTEEARALGVRLEVTPGAVVSGSSEMKRRVPDVQAYLKELRSGISRTEGLPGGVNSRQIADTMPNNRGGSALANMDENLSQTDTDFGNDRSLARADFLDDLGRRWDEISEVDPDFPKFLESYDEGADALKANERDLWRLVDEGEQPRFSNEALKAKAQKIIDETGYKRRDIPPVLRDILDEEITPGSSMPLEKFQELRSTLLGVVRDAKVQPLAANRNASRMAVDVLDSMADSINDFERLDLTGKSQQYKAARQATLENATLYDPQSTVVSHLEAGGTPKSLFSRVRSAKGRRGKRLTPESEAKRLVRIAEQTPGGMDNLRALAVDDLFVNGLNPTATRAPAKTLKTNEKVYRTILGDQYDDAVDLLELSYLGTRGKSGTAAQVASVGSGQSPAKFLFGLARAGTNPVQSAVEGAMSAVGKITRKNLMWQKIVREAIENPNSMRILMEMPTKKALPAWQVEWMKLVRKAGNRSVLRSGARSARDESGKTPKGVNK